MKKITLITGVIIIMTLLAGTVNAQSALSAEKATQDQASQTDQAISGNFIDKNGDGICDNIPDCCKNGKCTKFVDENGDGICDNCKGKENCSQANCCTKEMKKGECTTTTKSSCCSKDKGKQHCQGAESGSKAKSTVPEKK